MVVYRELANVFYCKLYISLSAKAVVPVWVPIVIRPLRFGNYPK